MVSLRMRPVIVCRVRRLAPILTELLFVCTRAKGDTGHGPASRAHARTHTHNPTLTGHTHAYVYDANPRVEEEEGACIPGPVGEHPSSFARRDPCARHASSRVDHLLSPSRLPEAHGLTDTSGDLHDNEGSLPTNHPAHRFATSNRNRPARARINKHTRMLSATNPQRHTQEGEGSPLADRSTQPPSLTR